MRPRGRNADWGEPCRQRPLTRVSGRLVNYHVTTKVRGYPCKFYTTQYLSGIYNAKNLTSNNDGTVYYFTAENGFYQMDKNGTGISLINGLLSDICVFERVFCACF